VNLKQLAARRLTLEDLEREYVRAVVAAVGGNNSEAAAILGIARKTLRNVGLQTRVPVAMHAPEIIVSAVSTVSGLGGQLRPRTNHLQVPRLSGHGLSNPSVESMYLACRIPSGR